MGIRKAVRSNNEKIKTEELKYAGEIPFAVCRNEWSPAVRSWGKAKGKRKKIADRNPEPIFQALLFSCFS